MDLATKLQLHYFFVDESHSMDALIRNKCEKEIIEIILEAGAILDLQINIESEAYREGGLKETWDFIGKNSPQLSLIVAIIAVVLTQVPSNEKESDLDKELKRVSIQEKRLSIKEKKLSIKKLKKELGENSVSDESIQQAVEVINDSYKVIVRRSNFYKQVDAYKKIEKVAYVGLDSKNRVCTNENIVLRKEFRKFILTTNLLKPITITEAKVEIVAPVLTGATAKWKGVYEETPINFSMNDSNFKEKVLHQGVSFQNGSSIICVLLIHKKLNEVGEIITVGHSVETVLEFSTGNSFTETPQGKEYRFTKKLVENQGNLFK